MADGTAGQPAATPAAAVAAQPSLGALMSFSGAPELINGRLAMLAFVVSAGKGSCSTVQNGSLRQRLCPALDARPACSAVSRF